MDREVAQVAALFDFDGTLYKGHIWQDLARDHWHTRRHRRWVAAYVIRNMAALPIYKLGFLSQVDFYRPWGETMAWLLRDWSVEEGQALFERLTEERVMPNLHGEIVDLVRQHQGQGHLVALVSALFTPWLALIAERMGVAHAIGTPIEVHNGRYTGRTLRPLCQGPGKLERARDYMRERGLPVNWADSYTYADGGTDVDLMSQVGHPVAVFPDDILRAVAQSHGWPILDGEDR